MQREQVSDRSILCGNHEEFSVASQTSTHSSEKSLKGTEIWDGSSIPKTDDPRRAALPDSQQHALVLGLLLSPRKRLASPYPPLVLRTPSTLIQMSLHRYLASCCVVEKCCPGVPVRRQSSLPSFKPASRMIHTRFHASRSAWFTTPASSTAR